MTMEFRVCSCNRTMPVDASGLAQALDAPVHGHQALCRRELPAFANAAATDAPMAVACTQEAALFSQAALGVNADRVAPIRFVNVRETGGWSDESKRATPKMAALLAQARVADPPPLPAVTYRSAGRTLVMGPAAAALRCAESLADELDVTVLITDAGPVAPRAKTRFATVSGEVTGLRGWLGAFEAQWAQRNPIDLEACVRCNACIDACPEDAIDFSYQIDLGKCASHRACVVACGEVRAIDFERTDVARSGRFDLVLDVHDAPVLLRDGVFDVPQGYFAPGSDVLAQAAAMATLRTLVGEFEKPRFFKYDAKICAHGRSGVAGCTNCIDACSTRAIRGDGDRVVVEPFLCMGCGACATVCPTGAMTHVAAPVSDLGARIKAMLDAYRRAGGTAPQLLVVDAHGMERIGALGQQARIGRLRGMPASLVPFEVLHVASFGLDATLAALAAGAVRVRFLATARTASSYVAALQHQADVADAVLRGLGWIDRHAVDVVEADDAATLDARLHDDAPVAAAVTPAPFAWQPAKRATLGMAIDHLHAHSPRAAEAALEFPLPDGAPFGTIEVDPQRCTLCMSCVGACPASALAAGQDTPMLRFIETNCVQCGLCANTCPEDAITLTPRLALGAHAKSARIVAQTRAYDCVRCGKPFGTARMVEAMLAKIGAHGAFAGNLDRLRMCGDCRVFDIMSSGDQARIVGVEALKRPEDA